MLPHQGQPTIPGLCPATGIRCQCAHPCARPEPAVPATAKPPPPAHVAPSRARKHRKPPKPLPDPKAPW